ncbi:MAG: NTP transferase domain-containing protein [Candidatus Bathyarchaeia archaeon]|jgi:adenosylcobinamide-phosphate guanylyltransferase
MKTTALVMAGGKGTRMALTQEKPLLEVGGKPVVSLVLDALANAEKLNSVVVAVSDYTPKTAAYLAGFSVKVVKTPGKEYVSDMGYAVKVLGLETVLAIAADMPLITGEIIDDVLEKYVSCGKSALVVAVPLETKRKLGMSLGYAFDHEGQQVVPAGININDGRRIDDEELEQDVYVLDRVEVAVNINTVDELKRAQELFAQTHKT